MVYNLIDRITLLAANRGLTLDELAERLDQSKKTMQKWRDGCYPRVTMIINIAYELDVSVDELMGTGIKAPDDLAEKAVEKMKEANERAERAIEDAKLAGCKTCRYGRRFNGQDYVCANQGGGQYPSPGLKCWEWRGGARDSAHE